MKRKTVDATLLRLLVGAGLLVFGFAAGLASLPWLSPVIFALGLLLSGYDVLWNALRGILRGQLLDETFLMSVAAIGAFCIGEYAEGMAVMLFYQVGEYFQARAVRRSRAAIRSLMDIAPDCGFVLRDGKPVEIPADQIAVGDTLLLRPGDRVPVDCTVKEGSATVNTAALTGESLPLDALPGTPLLAGFVIGDGTLWATADKPASASSAVRILELVQEATDRKSKQESFITSFARVYTPIVVGLALCVAFLPPLVLWDASLLTDWIRRALMFLVVSCPCALVISVPLAFFGGIGAGAARGILFKGGYSFDRLSKVKVAVFDKTGTLTTGCLAVTEVLPREGTDRETLLRLAAGAEQFSTHPGARAICREMPDAPQPTQVKEVAGKGVISRLDGCEVAVGNRRLMEEVGAAVPPDADGIFVSRDGIYLGAIVLGDTLRPEAPASLAELKRLGVEKTVMLTGDRASAAGEVARALGIDEMEAELLPRDKYDSLERILAEGKPTLYVGDGINDAPVLARADVGVAMGGIGSDSAIEAADLVLMADSLSRLPTAIRIARKTLSISRINIILALGVKTLVMALSALGLLNFAGGMWVAVFADVGVALLAVLNSLRTLRSARRD